MCRFALYLGPELKLGSLITEPENSIIHQSFHSHEYIEPLNGDGFGVAWYVPGDEHAIVFKEVSPAWNNVNLHSISRATRSKCILAHVRAATQGLPVQQLNCHPFSWGRLSFMHNGNVGGFSTFRRKILTQVSDDTFNWIKGSTDTEHVFALFIEHYQDLVDKHPNLEAMKLGLINTIHEVERLKKDAGVTEESTLNLVVCDGEQAVVSRYISPSAPQAKANTLYVHRGGRYECDGASCRMVPCDDDQAVIIASEPLSTDPGWERINPGTIMTLDAKLDIVSSKI